MSGARHDGAPISRLWRGRGARSHMAVAAGRELGVRVLRRIDGPGRGGEGADATRGCAASPCLRSGRLRQEGAAGRLGADRSRHRVWQLGVIPLTSAHTGSFAVSRASALAGGTAVPAGWPAGRQRFHPHAHHRVTPYRNLGS